MISMKSKLCGFYKLEAISAKTGKKRLLMDWFPNLITNGGLDRIGTASDWLNYCHVGAGNTAPANSNTALETFVGSASVNSQTDGVSGSSPYYRWLKKVYRFNPGEATGNIAEVGIGWTAATGSLFSRALILDGGGSPTTITILSDEYLDVTYECRRYLPESDSSSHNVTLRSIVHTITGGRAAYITNTSYWSMPFHGGDALVACYVYDGTIGAITSQPSGSSTTTTTKEVAAYVPGNHYRDWTYSFALDQGNLGGYISAIRVFLAGGNYQFGVSPDIEKTSDDIMSLTFRASWGRK